jgi:hypothetical protein
MPRRKPETTALPPLAIEAPATPDNDAEQPSVDAARHAQLDDVVRRETPDPTWTDEMRSYLQDAIVDLEAAARIHEVDCRTTTCRVELEVDDPEAGARLNDLVANADIPKETFLHLSSSSIGVTTYVLLSSLTEHAP